MKTKRTSRMISLLLSLVMALGLLPTGLFSITSMADGFTINSIEITVNAPYEGGLPDFQINTSSNVQSYSCIWYEGISVDGIPDETICLTAENGKRFDKTNISYTMRVFVSALSTYTLPDTPITVKVNGVETSLVKLPESLGYKGKYNNTYVVESTFAVTPRGVYNIPNDITGEYSAGWVTVSGTDEECYNKLKTLLKSNDTIAIRMEDDIDDYTISDIELGVIITLSGKKYLDLNGHDIRLYTKDGNEYTMISIPSGAEMILMDNSDDGDGELNYNGKIYDGADPESGHMARHHIFKVSGKLTMFGGVINPGRSKKQWLVAAYKDGMDDANFYNDYNGYVRNQVHGCGIIVNNGGELTVNGGSVFGRGFSYLVMRFIQGRCAAIVGNKGSTVTLNDGNFKGYGCADVLQIDEKCNFTVRAGTFDTKKVDKVRLPQYYEVYDSHGFGIDPTDNYTDGSYGSIGIPAGSVNAHTTNLIVGGETQDVDEDGNVSADSTSKLTYVEPKEWSTTQSGKSGVQPISGITSLSIGSRVYNSGQDYEFFSGMWTRGSAGLIKSTYSDEDRIFPANLLQAAYRLHMTQLYYYTWTLYEGREKLGTAKRYVDDTLDINGAFHDEDGNPVVMENGKEYFIEASVMEYWQGTNTYVIERIVGGANITVSDLDYSALAKQDLLKVTYRGPCSFGSDGVFSTCNAEVNPESRDVLDKWLTDGLITDWHIDITQTEHHGDDIIVNKTVITHDNTKTRGIYSTRIGFTPVTALVYVKYSDGIEKQIHSQSVDALIMPVVTAVSGVTATGNEQTVLLKDSLNTNSYAKLTAGIDVMAELGTNVFSSGENKGKAIDPSSINWQYCPDEYFDKDNTETIGFNFEGAVRGSEREETNNVLYARKEGAYRAFINIDGNTYYNAKPIILTSNVVYTTLPAKIESSSYHTSIGLAARLSLNLMPEQGITSEWSSNLAVRFQCVSAPEGANTINIIDSSYASQYLSGSGADITCLIDGFFREKSENVVPGNYAFRAIVEDVEKRIYHSGVLGVGTYTPTRVYTDEIIVTYDYPAENLDIFIDGTNITNQTGTGIYCLPAQVKTSCLTAKLFPDIATGINGNAPYKYNWTLTGNTTVGTISNITGKSVTFTALKPGTIRVYLAVVNSNSNDKVFESFCDITVPIAGFTVEKPTPYIGQDCKTLLPEISAVWSYDGAKIRDNIDDILTVKYYAHTANIDSVSVNTIDTYTYEFMPAEDNTFPIVQAPGTTESHKMIVDSQYVETNTFDSNDISSSPGRGFYPNVFYNVDPRQLMYDYTFEPLRDTDAIYLDTIEIVQPMPELGSAAVQGPSTKLFLNGKILTDLGMTEPDYENISYPMLKIHGTGKSYGDASMEERFKIDNVDFDWYFNAMYYGTDEGKELGITFDEVFYEEGTYLNYVSINLRSDAYDQKYYFSPNTKLIVNGVEVASKVDSDIQAGKKIYAQYYFNVGTVNTYGEAKLSGIVAPVCGKTPTSEADVECVDSSNNPLPLYVSRLAWFVDANNNGVMDSGEEARVNFKSDGTYDSASKLNEDGTFKSNMRYNVRATMELDETADGIFADNFIASIDANGNSVLMSSGTDEFGLPTGVYAFPTTENTTITSASATITAPAVGENPSYTIISGNSDKYTVEIEYWYLYEGAYPKLTLTDVFEAGKKYSLRVIFTPNSGYTFDDLAIFYINGVETLSYGSGARREVQFTVTSNQFNINNDMYSIKDGFLFGVKAETLPSELKKAFDSDISIINNSGEYVGTGSTVSIIVDGEVISSVFVVVKGDTNGDGLITITDYTIIKSLFLHRITLSGAFIKAADTDGDDRVTSTDYLMIKNHFLRKFNLFA